uniref:Uncharacterized protein n=1 Tax=Strigamia maritima TaxID=126957 RepID=T1JH87_STRMM
MSYTTVFLKIKKLIPMNTRMYAYTIYCEFCLVNLYFHPLVATCNVSGADVGGEKMKMKTSILIDPTNKAMPMVE